MIDKKETFEEYMNGDFLKDLPPEEEGKKIFLYEAQCAWSHQQQKIDKLEQENTGLRKLVKNNTDHWSKIYEEKEQELETQKLSNKAMALNNLEMDKEIKELRIDKAYLKHANEEIDWCHKQLEEAEKVIEFYGNWETSWEMDRIIPQDRELYFYANCDGVKMGGKKAREYLLKYKGE